MKKGKLLYLLGMFIMLIAGTLLQCSNEQCKKNCDDARDECISKVDARDPFDFEAKDECNRIHDNCIDNCN